MGDGLAPLAGKHILVVEDEPLIAIDIELEATGAGATVVRVFTVPKAMEALEGDVDGAVLDYTLPARKTADGVALELAARGIPFVFYSGDLDQHGSRMARHGAPVIAKPAPVRRVLETLAELLCQ